MTGSTSPQRFRLHRATRVVLGLAASALLGICLYLYLTIPRDSSGRISEASSLDEFYLALGASVLVLPVTVVTCELWISLRAVGREARALAKDLKRDHSDS